MTIRTRIAVAVGAAAIIAAGGAAASSAVVPHVASPVTGGNISVALNARTMTALHNRGIALKPIAPATVKNATLRLPTKGGTANPPYYTTKQSGGFLFTKGSKTITVTHLVFNTRTNRATADVTNHGNIIVLVLGSPQNGNGGQGFVEYGGYPVTMSYALTHALDHAFNVSTFVNYPKFGTGSTTVRF